MSRGGATDGCETECGAASGATTGDATPDFCIFKDDESTVNDAYRHDCDFGLQVAVAFEIAGGISTNEELYTGTVQSTLDISTPSHSAVSACCSDIEDDENYGGAFADTCPTIHHKACVSDLISFVCHQPGKWLEAEADRYTFEGNLAVQNAAEWLHDNRNQCYEHFWAEIDAIGGDDPFDLLQPNDFCDAAVEDGGTAVPWEPVDGSGNPKTWGDGLLGIYTVQNLEVTFTYNPSNDTGNAYIAPLPPGTQPVDCVDPTFNHGKIVLPYEKSDGTFPTPPYDVAPVDDDLGDLVASVDVDIEGPDWNGEPILGSGTFASTGSFMYSDTSYYYGFQDLYVGQWRWVSSADTTAGTASLTYDIEEWGMESVGIAIADVTDPYGAEWSIPAGGAVFNLSATVTDAGVSVIAKNSTAIDIELVNGTHPSCPGSGSNKCYKTHAFELEYEDTFGDTWTVDVAKAYWDL